MADRSATASDIGPRLRRLRSEAGRSLRSVAEAVGISSSALSQIETGAMQPSVNRLIELVNVIGVPVSAIFEDADVAAPIVPEGEGASEPIPGVNVVSSAAQAATALGQDVVYRRIMPARVAGVDLYETVYPPGTSSSIDGAMLVHEGYEVGRVVSGTLSFEFTEGAVSLGPGDSLSFWATRPHRVVNPSPDVAAVAIWMTVRSHGDAEAH